MPRAVNGLKKCTQCLRELPVSEFYGCKHTSDGLHTWCKKCFLQNDKARRTGRCMPVRPKRISTRPTVCELILKDHHDDLANDPERLSTKFIADVSGCSCRRIRGG